MSSGPGPSAGRARRGWFEEKQAAWLYRVIAGYEQEPVKRRLFQELACSAEAQAAVWASSMPPPGTPKFVPSRRAIVVAGLVRFFGVPAMRSVLASMKIRGLSVYRSAAAHWSNHPIPVSIDDIGRRHRGLTAGNLRAAVFGANDGLVSNASLIMGLAGAQGDARLILLAGLAGLFGGALSMAAGEYVSVRSQRELCEAQIDLERAELALYPEQEAAELELIWSARGMERAAARRLTRRLVADPERALDLLARDELGLNPDELGSPCGAAAFSFGAFAAGAAVPMMPFLAGLDIDAGIRWAIAGSTLALFAIGAMLSLFSGRSAVAGGARMLVIGSLAAATTYGLARLSGVALG
ncbi:MAG: VIT1/CCC1 transporter family protein [Methylotetracoccus sp.]